MLIQIDYNIRLQDYLKKCVKTAFYAKPFTKKWVSHALVCASVVAWDNYVPLQMISEYFPARGRPLNRVKKPTRFVEFEHVRNEPPYWISMLLDTGNESYN